jgi:transcription elongation factor Elf1
MKEHNYPCPADPEEDLVHEMFGCPRCGERRVDYLVWLEEDSEHVECQTCCYVYEP